VQHRVSPGAAKSLHGFLFVVQQQQQQQQRQRQSMETEYIEHSHLHSRPKNKLSRTTNMILLMANGAFYNDCDRSFFIAFARFLVFPFFFFFSFSLWRQFIYFFIFRFFL
jgi:hypothetical protein